MRLLTVAYINSQRLSSFPRLTIYYPLESTMFKSEKWLHYYYTLTENLPRINQEQSNQTWLSITDNSISIFDQEK